MRETPVMMREREMRLARDLVFGEKRIWWWYGGNTFSAGVGVDGPD